MSETYSTYEAKSRFSEIIRRVRQGARIVVSYHGEPVAEISPIAPARRTLSETLVTLERDGVVASGGGGGRPAATATTWRVVAKKPGALKRFLRSRD